MVGYPLALVVYEDRRVTVVLCPYCYQFEKHHRHGVIISLFKHCCYSDKFNTTIGTATYLVRNPDELDDARNAYSREAGEGPEEWYTVSRGKRIYDKPASKLKQARETDDMTKQLGNLAIDSTESSQSRKLVASYSPKVQHLRSDDEEPCIIQVARKEEDESTLKALEKLLNAGAEVDEQNDHKRTALMEAALLGRLTTVQYLLCNGADPKLRDEKGKSALDLAPPSERNEQERLKSLELLDPKSKADPLNTTTNRWTITRILYYRENPYDISKKESDTFDVGKISRIKLLRTNSEGFEYGFFNGTKTRLQLYRVYKSYTFPGPFDRNQKDKTIAVLDRGDKYEPVSSMSGYQQGPQSNVLNNTEWTEKVKKLATFIGYEDDGDSFMSHAERQLTAWYVEEHVLRRYLGATIAKLDGVDIEQVWNVVFNFARKLPSRHIVISNEKGACGNCERFLKQLKKTLRVDFDINVGVVMGINDNRGAGVRDAFLFVNDSKDDGAST